MNSSPTYGRVVEINHRWTWLVEDGSDFSQCTTPLLPHSYFLFYSKHDVSNSLVDFWLGNAANISRYGGTYWRLCFSVFFLVRTNCYFYFFIFIFSLEKVLKIHNKNLEIEYHSHETCIQAHFFSFLTYTKNSYTNNVYHMFSSICFG